MQILPDLLDKLVKVTGLYSDKIHPDDIADEICDGINRGLVKLGQPVYFHVSDVHCALRLVHSFRRYYCTIDGLYWGIGYRGLRTDVQRQTACALAKVLYP